MGKTGKERKKRKLLQQSTTTTASTTTHPAKRLRLGDAVNGDDDGDGDVLINGEAEDIATAVRVLAALADDGERLKLPQYKALRAVLWKLQRSSTTAGVNTGQTLPGKVSDAIANKQWDDAVALLKDMRDKGMRPKLGALQRWVRDCDAANSHKKSGRDEVVMRVLDAVLRTADPSLCGAGKGPAGEQTLGFSDCTIKHVPWDAGHPSSLKREPTQAERDASVELSGRMVVPSEQDRNHFASLFSVIAREEGKDRRPPNKHPMILYRSQPSTISMEPASKFPPPRRIPLPHVPNTIMIKDIITIREASQMLRAVETLGFIPDEPTSTPDSNSVLAHNVFWLADDDLLSTLTERCRPFLPETITDDDGLPRTFVGINARWRVYRYVPGHVYRPHIDGAWPRSTYTDDEGYVYDASNGTTWSRFTFLLYLNEGFTGGETTYFLPREEVGTFDARSVVPRCGSVVCFPHGSVAGVLLHEGSGVIEGVKYIVRTDVLYERKGAPDNGAIEDLNA